MWKISSGFCLLVIVLCAFAYPVIQVTGDFPDRVYPLPGTKDSLQVLLGKILFYDPVLSVDSSISCASCHSPYQAFAHADHARSHGIFNRVSKRNAPPLFNLAWKKLFMRDGAVNHLDVQALAPIENSLEMGERFAHVVEKIKKQAFYRELFRRVYGTPPDGAGMLKALTAFELTLESKNSRYDSVRAGTVSFTEQEQKGYALFKQHCNECHTEPLFTKNGFASNGLSLDTSIMDFGRMGITGEKKDSLMFAIPSLRNLRYTAPYMHDGRMASLSLVLKHYGRYLPENTKSQGEILGERQQKDLLAFLACLNDPLFVFSEANKYPLKKIKELREITNQPTNHEKE